MSLKTDYYDGETGLHQQLNNAFDAGVAFVGGGAAEVDALSLNGVTGVNLTQEPIYTFITNSVAMAIDTIDTPNITFMALNPGAAGNSIVLVFDGIATVATVVGAWNVSNPSNQVNYSSLGSVVPMAQTVNLSGGGAASAGAVYANNGNNFTVSTTVTGTTLISTGPDAPQSSGTLTKVSGTGDATINFASFSVVFPAGLYYDQPASNGLIYRMWYQVETESQPTLPSTLYVPVQIDVLTADNATNIATKTVTALNAIPTSIFNASSSAEVVTIANTIDGVLPSPISIGTLTSASATAYVIQLVPGVNATGSFAELQVALIGYAAQGITDFIVEIVTGFQPQYLRGNNGGRWNQYGSNNSVVAPYGNYNQNSNGYTTNSSNVPDRYGNNLLLKAYLAGISAGLADQNIYNYECTPSLNTSDNNQTSINFHFHFQTT